MILKRQNRTNSSSLASLRLHKPLNFLAFFHGASLVGLKTLRKAELGREKSERKLKERRAQVTEMERNKDGTAFRHVCTDQRRPLVRQRKMEASVSSCSSKN
ncbi:Nucleoplasmin-3 [Manis pentadactyla]|nr:Nucleoplasmin-3 [Manis pentadactyla]